MCRPGQGRALLIVTVLVAAVGLGACDSSGGGSETSSVSRVARAELEVRPVRALLPPGDPTVPADADKVVEPAAGNGLRYALGPAALSGAVVRRARARDLGGNGQSWIVQVHLTPSGARRLEALGHKLKDQDPPRNSAAVLVGGRMESQVMFGRSSRASDSIQIVGDLDEQQARDLAASISPRERGVNGRRRQSRPWNS